MSLKFLILFTIFTYTLSSISSGKNLKSTGSCTAYKIKSGDGLWALSNNWCKDGNGWSEHIFTDSNCTSNLTSADIKVGETIYFGAGCVDPDTPSAGKNIFISYISDKDIYNKSAQTKIWPNRFMKKNIAANDFGSQVDNKGLKGAMMWEISGDFPISNELSQKHAMLTHPGFKGKVSGFYWANWDMYLESHAIPSPSQPITNFQSDFSALSKANRDVYVYYAFMETITETDESANITEEDLGTLYFFDPWSDLSPESCSDNSLTDTYVMKIKKNYKTKPECNNASHYDNFNKFAKLTDAVRLVSIGGYSYNKTFEIMYDNKGGLNEQISDTFIKSAVDLIKKYDIDGVDLDYEDLDMTKNMSESYLALVKKMRKYFDENGLEDKKITVTCLSDPKYLKGVRNGDFGFSNLSEFEPYIDSLQLMTYDFHGAFDFMAGGSNITGFNSNLSNDSDYAPTFSVANSVQSALDSIPASKIVIGIPAYGRSIANIKNIEGKQGVKGLGQGVMEGKTFELVAGDMDNKGCETSSVSPCTGMFSYRYIVENLLKEGFEGVQAISPEIASAAYAESWTPPAPPKTCTEYSIKSGDGLWSLSNAWCNDGDGWETHIFTDSECTKNISSSNVKVGDTIYFGTGCKSPN